MSEDARQRTTNRKKNRPPRQPWPSPLQGRKKSHSEETCHYAQRKLEKLKKIHLPRSGPVFVVGTFDEKVELLPQLMLPQLKMDLPLKMSLKPRTESEDIFLRLRSSQVMVWTIFADQNCSSNVKTYRKPVPSNSEGQAMHFKCFKKKAFQNQLQHIHPGITELHWPGQPQSEGLTLKSSCPLMLRK